MGEVPLILEPPAPEYIALFWQRVQKAEGDACWLWSGRPMKAGGYGRAQLAARRTERAHRVSYVIHFGPIPYDACVLHRCDVPLCVRPDHLFLGDRGINARDMAAKGRAHLQRNPQAFAGERNWKRRHPELIRLKPPAPCVNCGVVVKPRKRQRCIACNSYLVRCGVERPSSLFSKKEQSNGSGVPDHPPQATEGAPGQSPPALR